MGSSSQTLAPALLAVLLLFGACQRSGPERPSGSPKQPSADFVSGGECPVDPAGELPDDSGCVTRVKGDLDGDGSEDTATVYARLGEDRRPLSWRLRVDITTTEIDQALDAGSPHSYPRAIGAADVEGDGRDELFLKVLDLAGHGTAWQRFGIFVLRGRNLEPLTYEGEPLALGVGGVSRMGQGAECSGGRLVIVRAEARNRRNTIWDFSDRYFRIWGRRAQLVRTERGVLQIDRYDDPKLDRFYGLDCNGLRYLP